MTRTQIKEALETHAQECLTRLEEFKTIQTEYNMARRALRVFNGEALGKGNPAPAKRGGKTYVWTPEQRAAQAKRMKALMNKKYGTKKG